MDVKSSLLIVLSVCLTVSCSKRQETVSLSCDEIHFYERENPEAIDSLRIEFVSFDNSQQSLIGSVQAVVKAGNRLFVADDTDYKLLAFDTDGHYLATVGSRGQGAGEYVHFASFFTDEEAGKIGILDEEQRKVVYYELNDYSFSHEVFYRDISSSCCIPFRNGLLWYNENYEDNITDRYFLYTDNAGDVTDSYVIKEFKSGYITGAPYPLYSLDGRVYGYTPYDMTVYEFDNSGVRPRFHIDIEGFSTPSVRWLNSISDGGRSGSLFSSLAKSEFISYYSVLESQSTLCVSFIRQKNKYVALLNKKNGASILIGKDDLAAALHLGKIAYFIPQSIDGAVLAVLDTAELAELSEDPNVMLRDQIREYLDSGNDNPLIVKLSF